MSEFQIRFAIAADAATIAWHRARMWQDMGDLPHAFYEPLRQRATTYFRYATGRGEYVGWLAAPADDARKIVAGAGVLLRDSLPSPRRKNGQTAGVAQGKLGLMINVFTEPDWRRQGAAMQLIDRVISWSRQERLDRLELHASDSGRPLYEKLGFVPTNEMRLAEL